MNPHPPSHIFTNHLCITNIVVSHEDPVVYLLGIYGNLPERQLLPIEIQTNFETLNDLVYCCMDADQQDEAITALAHALLHPAGDRQGIELVDPGGLLFFDHLFALQAIVEEDENGNVTLPAEPSYFLHGYIKREASFPGWLDMDFGPSRKEARAQGYRWLLSLQYHLYLYFVTRFTESVARKICNLTHSLVFEMAQAQYELNGEVNGE